MFEIANLKLVGELKLQNTTGENPFVFLGYASFDLVIPVGAEGLEATLHCSSVQLKQWERNGLSVQFPSTPYQATDENGSTETRYSRKVAGDAVFSALLRRSLLKHPEVRELSALGDALLTELRAA